MKILADYNFEELTKELVSLPKFRAKQVFDAIIQAKDWEQTTIPKKIYDELKMEYVLKPISIYEIYKASDGTKKYLLKLHDNNIIECVFLTQDYGNTICMSTQVGCRMGCKFCASTMGGLIRNLTAGEMLASIAVVNADNGECTKRNFSNIVLMGSGEPFDNYNNVVKFLRLVTGEGFNVSERNISLSTCGLVDKIYEFMKLNFNITLCISLHASTNEKRKEVMPIAFKYSIEEIAKAVKDYADYSKRRVVLEYCLIKGVNDSFEDCKRLTEIFKGVLCHFNIICLNPKDDKLKATTKKEAYAFIAKLQSLGLSASLRRSQGADIQGACGQLRAKRLGI
ncbi:MAG: 23S rRNA (adenine(2503)-C(2))-methyltransferase RlmN [Clostridia bacterium]|nr:23S rRNA (adenine(2503)-C(2))-methyltransferase RlmN [Clostridia bacterium]